MPLSEIKHDNVPDAVDVVVEIGAVEYLKKWHQSNADERQLMEAGGIHTILSNAVRPMEDLAELVMISDAKPRDIMNIATLPFSRLALFETIAIIETDLRITEEQNLYDVVRDVYDGAIVPMVERAVEDGIDKKTSEYADQYAHDLIDTIEQIISEEKLDIASLNYDSLSKMGRVLPTDMFFKNALNTYLKFRTNPAYSPSPEFMEKHELRDRDSAVNLLTHMAVSDLVYRSQIQAEVTYEVMRCTREAINERIKTGVRYPVYDPAGKDTGDTALLEYMSIQPGQERHTFMLAGPPACGKGTLLGMMIYSAKAEYDVEWDNVVKINTDTHRPLVSEGCPIGDDKRMHAAYNNDESIFITDRAYDKVKTQLNNDHCHHLLIDCVNPNQERMALGLDKEGEFHIAVVSAPPSVAVLRAQKRGDATGRYVSTNYLVNCHSTVTKAIYEQVITNNECYNKKVQVDIFDTNVKKDTPPNRLLHVDMQSMQAVIEDAEGLKNFDAKKYISPVNTSEPVRISSAGIFSQKKRGSVAYITTLVDRGFLVTPDVAEDVHKKQMGS